jgi:hypothetical protein
MLNTAGCTNLRAKRDKQAGHVVAIHKCAPPAGQVSIQAYACESVELDYKERYLERTGHRDPC